MYKIFHGISKSMMNEIFTLRHQKQYNLRNWSDFCVPKIGSIKVACVVNITLFFYGLILFIMI